MVTIKEQDKVLAWDFRDNGDVKPLYKKTNRVAVITDGAELFKITIFEGFALHLKEETYFMKGYTLRGENPPYKINITKTTQFFKTLPLMVGEEMRARAEVMLHPESHVKSLASREVKGLLTVEGEVMQVS